MIPRPKEKQGRWAEALGAPEEQCKLHGLQIKLMPTLDTNAAPHPPVNGSMWPAASPTMRRWSSTVEGTPCLAQKEWEIGALVVW